MPLDDTLCEHVGSLFEYVDRHYNHGEQTYPLAHNLVTSHYVSGAVRFPLSWRLYRRYEEWTQWETFVGKHFPETFYQDAKQQLGLNEYRMRKAEAIQKHWALVFVAYSFLHLACLPPSRRHQVHQPVKTIGQVICQQTQQVIEALILHAHTLLKQGCNARQVFDQLFAKQAYTMAC